MTRRVFQVKRPLKPRLRYLQRVELHIRPTASGLPGTGGDEEPVQERKGDEYREDQFTRIYPLDSCQITNVWTDQSGEASGVEKASKIVDQRPWVGWGGRALRVIFITLITVALWYVSNLPLALACMVMVALLFSREWRRHQLQRSLRPGRGR